MFELLLGHLAGDYLLQNEWMALNKSKNTRTGWLAAFVHCVLYTLAVCLFMQNFQPIWIGVVFLTHFPIDKFMLAEKYLHFIKGKGLKDYVYREGVNLKQTNRFEALEGGFTALVYSVTDNAMHLILMWGAYKIIY